MPWVAKQESGDTKEEADHSNGNVAAGGGRKGGAKAGDGGGKSNKDDQAEGKRGKQGGKGKEDWRDDAAKGKSRNFKDDEKNSGGWKDSGKGQFAGEKGAHESAKGKFGGKDSAFGGKDGGKKGGGPKGRFDPEPFDYGKGGRWQGGKGDAFDADGKGGGKGGKKGGTGKPEGGGGGSRGGALEKPDRTNRSEDSRRQVLVEKGQHNEVKKHSSMGCAVVTMSDARVRQAILNALGTEATIEGITVKLKPHTDKDSDREVPTDIFVGWGRQVEKATPLAEADIAKFFDQLHTQMVASGRLEDLARSAHPTGALGAGARAAPVPPPSPGGLPPPSPVATPQGAAAIPGNPYHAAQQAQYMAQMQHYQYLMMCQQQQALAYYQQQAYYQNQAAPQGERGPPGSREYKAAYRYPTDDEVKNRLQRIQGGPQRKPEAPGAPAAAAADAAAETPEASGSPAA